MSGNNNHGGSPIPSIHSLQSPQSVSQSIPNTPNSGSNSTFSSGSSVSTGINVTINNWPEQQQLVREGEVTPLRPTATSNMPPENSLFIQPGSLVPQAIESFDLDYPAPVAWPSNNSTPVSINSSGGSARTSGCLQLQRSNKRRRSSLSSNESEGYKSPDELSNKTGSNFATYREANLRCSDSAEIISPHAGSSRGPLEQAAVYLHAGNSSASFGGLRRSVNEEESGVSVHEQHQGMTAAIPAGRNARVKVEAPTAGLQQGSSSSILESGFLPFRFGGPVLRSPILKLGVVSPRSRRPIVESQNVNDAVIPPQTDNNQASVPLSSSDAGGQAVSITDDDGAVQQINGGIGSTSTSGSNTEGQVEPTAAGVRQQDRITIASGSEHAAADSASSLLQPEKVGGVGCQQVTETEGVGSAIRLDELGDVTTEGFIPTRRVGLPASATGANPQRTPYGPHVGTSHGTQSTTWNNLPFQRGTFQSSESFQDRYVETFGRRLEKRFYAAGVKNGEKRNIFFKPVDPFNDLYCVGYAVASNNMWHIYNLQKCMYSPNQLSDLVFFEELPENLQVGVLSPDTGCFYYAWLNKTVHSLQPDSSIFVKQNITGLQTSVSPSMVRVTQYQMDAAMTEYPSCFKRYSSNLKTFNVADPKAMRNRTEVVQTSNNFNGNKQNVFTKDSKLTIQHLQDGYSQDKHNPTNNRKRRRECDDDDEDDDGTSLPIVNKRACRKIYNFYNVSVKHDECGRVFQKLETSVTNNFVAHQTMTTYVTPFGFSNA